MYQALSYQCFRPQATRLNEFFFCKSGILGDLDEKTGLQQFIVGTLEEGFQYDLPVPGTDFTRFTCGLKLLVPAAVHCRHARRGVPIRPPCPRYSLYSLSWYKSTNTDAKRAAQRQRPRGWRTIATRTRPARPHRMLHRRYEALSS